LNQAAFGSRVGFHGDLGMEWVRIGYPNPETTILEEMHYVSCQQDKRFAVAFLVEIVPVQTIRGSAAFAPGDA
jgi:hypothetical protein